MIAGLFVVTGKDYVALCRKIGKTAEAERMQQAVDAMIDAVKKHGWDGEWYLRAYDFYGRKIGSNECDEAKIFIESQGWCTMAEIGAEDGLVAKSLDSCKKYLECEHGMVLNNPAFSKYIYEYGEISSYPEGYKEVSVSQAAATTPGATMPRSSPHTSKRNIRRCIRSSPTSTVRW